MYTFYTQNHIMEYRSNEIVYTASLNSTFLSFSFSKIKQ